MSSNLMESDRGPDNGDDFWAFEFRGEGMMAINTKEDLPPQSYLSSALGRTYIIDLSPEKYKQTKSRQKVIEGASNTRYVYNLGTLKMKEKNINGTKKKILCLHRHKIWWMRPSFLSSDGLDHEHCIVPPETVFLLGLSNNANIQNVEVGKESHEEHVYRLVLPLIAIEPDGNGCTSCSLRSSSTNSDMNVELHSETGGKVALYCGVGQDPFKLIEDGMQMASFCSKTNIDISKATTLDYTTLKHASLKEEEAVLAIQNRNDEARTSMQNENYPMSMNVLPSFAKNLGWCTWNAFYTQLSGEKIINAVQMLKEKNVPVKWIIIDDGWQHTTDDEAVDGMQWGERLLSTNKASPVKFAPGDVGLDTYHDKKPVRQMSLKDTVEELKSPSRIEEWCLPDNQTSSSGLEAVLAWHALPGYWLGLANDEEHSAYCGPAAKLHFPHFSTNIIENDASLLLEKSITKGIGIANNPTIFYDQYHSFLQLCGFDGVKVDAQAVSGFLRPHQCSNDDVWYKHRHKVSYQLQDALATSVNQRFKSAEYTTSNESMISTRENYDVLYAEPPNSIMCMSHSLDIIYRLPHLYGNSKPLMRASDDFYPKNDFCHGPHLVACAYNSLLLGQYATPDWDMFTTESNAIGEMHARARSISGGPIYFSDKPEEVNPKIMKRLACENGVILPCCTYARPTRDSLLNDPESSPLILWNVNGQDKRNELITSGLIAIFQLQASGRWCYDKLNFVKSHSFEPTDELNTIKVKPGDIEPFQQKAFEAHRFVAMSLEDGVLEIIPSPMNSVEVNIGNMKSALIHMLPIHNVNDTLGVFAIGIARLYNFAGAVKMIDILHSHREVEDIEGENDPSSGEPRISHALGYQIEITIHLSGCGNFFVGYECANDLNEEDITISVDGDKAESWLFNPRFNQQDEINKKYAKNRSILQTMMGESYAMSFQQHDLYLQCIKVPHNHDTSRLSVLSIKMFFRTNTKKIDSSS